MKKLGLGIVVVVVLVVAGLFWLRSNLDGLAKDAIGTYGSAMTKAKVSVGAVELHTADGTGVIRKLSIGNPAGFKTPYAIKVGKISVGVDISSLTKDVIVIRKIAIEAPDVIYEKGESMTNFDAIRKNIASYLGTSKSKSNAGGKKLIVDELTVRDGKAQASAAFMHGKTVSVPLPNITLHNIGKAKGGVPPGELGQDIAVALQHKLSSAIDFSSLAKSAGQTLQNAGSKVKESAGQTLEKAGSKLKGLFGK